MGCNKRYTDPSSLRKHKKNHCQFKQPSNQFTGGEQFTTKNDNQAFVQNFAEMDVDNNLELKINKKIKKFDSAISLKTETPFGNEMSRNLSNNSSSIYASCPNVNYAGNPEENEQSYSMMMNYNNGINQSMNNDYNCSNSSLPQRRPAIAKRERQLSSSFSGKFSSFYSTFSLANEAMEDDTMPNTPMYSPSNSQFSSPVAYRTFSAPTSPIPNYFNQQAPIFQQPNGSANGALNENNIIDYDRQTNQMNNFYQTNYQTETATQPPNQLNSGEQTNDYFLFYPTTTNQTAEQQHLNKYSTNETSNGSYYFANGSTGNAFNS